MGWANVKAHYRIGHIVHVCDNHICIGSPYCSELIKISIEGKIVKRQDFRSSNEDLVRYLSEMDADPEKLVYLVKQPDFFNETRIVYTWSGAEIITELCDKIGYPNVTHDGELMYENTFSTDKSQVIKWAKRDAECGIESARRNIAEKESELNAIRQRLAKAELNLAKLESDYPSSK